MSSATAAVGFWIQFWHFILIKGELSLFHSPNNWSVLMFVPQSNCSNDSVRRPPFWRDGCSVSLIKVKLFLSQQATLPCSPWRTVSLTTSAATKAWPAWGPLTASLTRTASAWSATLARSSWGACPRTSTKVEPWPSSAGVGVTLPWWIGPPS